MFTPEIQIVLQSNNDREFSNQIVSSLKHLWPDLGKSKYSKSKGQCGTCQLRHRKHDVDFMDVRTKYFIMEPKSTFHSAIEKI